MYLGGGVSEFNAMCALTGPAEHVHRLHIKDGEVGHSYCSVFQRCLDGNVTWVEVQDPYLSKRHQLHNLVRLCELLVKHCAKLREVKVTTSKGEMQEGAPVSE